MALAQQNGVSLREWGRLTSAVKEEWNSLAYLLTIELAEPKGGSQGLPGGGTQFYIPNLRVGHIAHSTFRPLGRRREALGILP